MTGKVFKVKKQDLDKSLYYLKKTLQERRLFLKKMNMEEGADEQAQAIATVLQILMNLQGEKYDA